MSGAVPSPERSVAQSREARVRLFAALGEPVRLGIVDELAIADCSPSELRAAFGMESNLLAHHLGVLERAGVIERVASQGDRRRRYVRLRPDVAELLTLGSSVAGNRVLFVCTHNSARSQLAAAMWNATSRIPARSAGTEPADRVHPQAVRAAQRRGLDLSDAVPQALDAANLDADVVVTVCDRAHEALPGLSSPRRLLHWSVADPADVGTRAAFDAAADQLERRVATLAGVISPN